MAEAATFVVVGGGLAGAKAVETLRDEGFDGQVVLIAREPVRPYERPPLSKEVLAGKKERDSVFVHDESWYADHDVELLTGTEAVALDLDAHEVELHNGRRVHFDKLLLATGAWPRHIEIPGANLEGVHYLRTLEDSDALREQFAGGGKRIVVVGGGWIGLEATAAARGYGNDVTVIEPQPTVLFGPLGLELGEIFAELHREHGVNLLLGEGVESFAAAAESDRVGSVRTQSGEDLPADLVLVGVGAAPEVGLAEAAGLSVDNGVLVDASLQTSNPDVYAAGDIANVDHPLLHARVRVEHWANALHSGPAAARAMLGQDVTFDRVPYFYTDQYDLGMEYSGWIGPEGYDEVVVRGDLGKREFIAFWLRHGQVLAGMNVNVWDVTDDIQAHVRADGTVDSERLADPDVELASLLPLS
jgi:3-phenylpropionate/trans-cinnamate dioxygenase ferredoxin reductase component